MIFKYCPFPDLVKSYQHGNIMQVVNMSLQPKDKDEKISEYSHYVVPLT